jgi:AraC-like DNA-binding protein
MQSLGEPLAVSEPGVTPSHECMQRVIGLLRAGVRQLHDEEPPALSALREAASLLRQQIDARLLLEFPDGRGRLLAWQVRKVRDYIDSHITGPLRVADLCALVQRSEAHFSRSFRCTFGESPHAFVIRRRLELAARSMLQTDASLSEIALRCGFADQAHLCKVFRKVTGLSPALWRRTCRTHHEGNVVPPSSETQWLSAILPPFGNTSVPPIATAPPSLGAFL